MRKENDSVTSITTTVEVPSPKEVSTPETKEPEYPGQYIDQVFLITANSEFSEELINKPVEVPMNDLTVHFMNHYPVKITKNADIVFKFDKKETGYSGFVTGSSKLLGADSDEIYIAVSSGGVCCTDYLLTDVSGEKPRDIFRSEKFGYFRSPMEVFDHNGDGIYELMRWDSCFRYFMNDCGSCSPEPRAYFKYDAKRGEYLPAVGIMQAFYREFLIGTETELEKQVELLKGSEQTEISEFDHRRSVLAYFADLVHFGEEAKAWNILKKYGQDDAETKKAIKERLGNCKFYQHISKLK